jgi:hypothetical protein
VAVPVDLVVPDDRVLTDLIEDALPEVVLDKVVLDESAAPIPTSSCI